MANLGDLLRQKMNELEKAEAELEETEKMNSSKRHVHATLIHAWAEGAEIEYRLPGINRWEKSEHPSWGVEIDYRIKSKVVAVRIAVMMGEDGNEWLEIESPSYAQHEHHLDHKSEFNYWLTDWLHIDPKTGEINGS